MIPLTDFYRTWYKDSMRVGTLNKIIRSKIMNCKIPKVVTTFYARSTDSSPSHKTSSHGTRTEELITLHTKLTNRWFDDSLPTECSQHTSCSVITLFLCTVVTLPTLLSVISPPRFMVSKVIPPLRHVMRLHYHYAGF